MGVRKLDATKRSTVANALASKFAGRIIGQDAAREALTNLLDKFASGMYNKKKPVGSLLFLGPTGTGKTLVAETFAEGLFGATTKMIKVDCAEFQHSHEIAKLIGSPPGYLGHRETHPFFTNSRLLEARQDDKGKEILPFTVILFDEIEKASDALWNLLLGILDKGSLTTGDNCQVDMTKTVIMMTSNVGATELADKVFGFITGEAKIDDSKMEEIAKNAARRKFLPEFLNRFDEIVMFKTLRQAELEKILDFEITKIQQRILFDSSVMFELLVSLSAKERLLVEGYDKRYNARHLVRAVDRYIATPLTRLIATKQVNPADTVIVKYSEADGWEYGASDGRR